MIAPLMLLKEIAFLGLFSLLALFVILAVVCGIIEAVEDLSNRVTLPQRPRPSLPPPRPDLRRGRLLPERKKDEHFS